MALHEILLMGDPVLRTPAEGVDVFDDALRELVTDMFETMYHAEGVGLAAPQIGISKRVLVVDVREDGEKTGRRLVLVNPSVAGESKKRDRSAEGCLSIPGLEEVVERASKVEIHGFDEHGTEVRLEAEELFGRVLQHEIDHLDGLLFVDRLSPLKRRMVLKKWRKLRAEEENKKVRK